MRDVKSDYRIYILYLYVCREVMRMLDNRCVLLCFCVWRGREGRVG